MRRYVVSSVAIAAMVLAGFLLLLIFPHGELDGELAIPGVGLIFGIDVLLLALLRCTNPYMSVRLHYLIGGAFTLLAGVAVLALLFGVTLSGAYIWTVIVGLGFIVIFWLTVLFWMSVGERLLRQGTASGGDLFGQWQTQSETQETRNEM